MDATGRAGEDGAEFQLPSAAPPRHHHQGSEGRGGVRGQRGKDVDHQRSPGRLDVSPGQHRRRAPPQEQVPHLLTHEPARWASATFSHQQKVEDWT